MNIPEHDRRILNCLGAKLLKKCEDNKYNYDQQLVWEEERERRQNLKKEQDRQYGLYLLAKHEAEVKVRRRQKLYERELEEWERDIIVEQIEAKDEALQRRLDVIQRQKNNEIQRRREMNQFKSDCALDIVREKAFEEIFWRKRLNKDLSLKMASVSENKSLFLQFIKKKTSYDINVHEACHRMNMDRIRFAEQEYLLMSKSQVRKKLQRIERLKERREQALRESRDTAMLTSRLRENLKKSFLPPCSPSW